MTATSAPLQVLSGWCVASPLCIDRRLAGRCDVFNVMPDGTILVHCDTLLLVNRDGNQTVPGAIELTSSISRFLNAIRVVCGQPEIPRSVVAHTPPHDIDDVVLPDDLPTTTTQSTFRRYILDSATTFDHLRAASDAVMNDALAVHREMASDAAEAAISSNYRSAIIFSAAAIESCAGSTLDAEYERQLNEPCHGPEHRFITIQVTRNDSVTKDPIYLALRNGSGDGGSRFLTLLHECPLYLLGRSIKIGNAELYRKAHSLYRTRNRLAHTGTTEGRQDGLLAVDFKGAMDAIRIANEVMDWFGEPSTVVPDHEMVELAGTDNK